MKQCDRETIIKQIRVCSISGKDGCRYKVIYWLHSLNMHTHIHVNVLKNINFNMNVKLKLTNKNRTEDSSQSTMFGHKQWKVVITAEGKNFCHIRQCYAFNLNPLTGVLSKSVSQFILNRFETVGLKIILTRVIILL